MARQFQIGQLASSMGINPKTIRYYEDIGLLPMPHRANNGYRIHDQMDEARLRFSAKAKHLGFSLDDIKSVLTVKRNGECPCDYAHELIDGRITELDEQLPALATCRDYLARLKDQPVHVAANGATICRIIER